MRICRNRMYPLSPFAYNYPVSFAASLETILPANIFKSVVFPAPELPNIAVI